LFAMTPNDEVNSLAALHFGDLFDRNDVYQLQPESGSSSQKSGGIPSHLRGRFLFDERATFDYLTRRFIQGAVVKKNFITNEFTYSDFKAMYGESALPLLVITESKNLKIFTAETKHTPQPGQTLISVVESRID
jgi:hypothetical protein